MTARTAPAPLLPDVYPLEPDATRSTGPVLQEGGVALQPDEDELPIVVSYFAGLDVHGLLMVCLVCVLSGCSSAKSWLAGGCAAVAGGLWLLVAWAQRAPSLAELAQEKQNGDELRVLVDRLTEDLAQEKQNGDELRVLIDRLTAALDEGRSPSQGAADPSPPDETTVPRRTPRLREDRGLEVDDLGIGHGDVDDMGIGRDVDVDDLGKVHDLAAAADLAHARRSRVLAACAASAVPPLPTPADLAQARRDSVLADYAASAVLPEVPPLPEPLPPPPEPLRRTWIPPYLRVVSCG